MEFYQVRSNVRTLSEVISPLTRSRKCQLHVLFNCSNDTAGLSSDRQASLLIGFGLIVEFFLKPICLCR